MSVCILQPHLTPFAVWLVRRVSCCYAFYTGTSKMLCIELSYKGVLLGMDVIPGLHLPLVSTQIAARTKSWCFAFAVVVGNLARWLAVTLSREKLKL